MFGDFDVKNCAENCPESPIMGSGKKRNFVYITQCRIALAYPCIMQVSYVSIIR